MRCGILFYSIGKLLGGSKQEDDVIRFAFLKDLTGCCVKNEKERGQVERHHRSQQGPGNETKVAWARVVVTEIARRGGSQASVPVGRGRKWEAPFRETLSVSKAGDSQDKALQSLTLAANPISTHLLLDGICLLREQEVRAKHRSATRGFSGWRGGSMGGLFWAPGCETVWMLRERQTRGPSLTHWTRVVQAFF